MTRIFTPTESAAILRAMQDIELANNGWSFIPADEAVHAGLQAAGYVVLRSTDGHGRPAWRGYTRRAAVGPVYRTQAELLADLDRYARETWSMA